MADTNNRALEAFEAFMKTEAPSDYDASNGDAWYVWKACWAAALASRPAEVDDMMPVTEPVAWRHTLDEGSYFANGRNYQLLDDWDAAFADWMLHGGVLQSLYSGPDTHELSKEAKDERAD